MKVCIAEKPSVAREIAQILGANSRKDGYLEGNGYRVTWTFGHLCTLNEPDDYTSEWKRWNLAALPMVPDEFDIKLIPNSGVGKQFRTIKSLINDCDEVINCGDAGIEGELIQRWVLKKAGCKKPVKRLWISSLTEEAIREGFTKLKDGSEYDLLYEAGNSRAIGDWLLGMNATRLYTLKYANGRGVLSIGRVQTPTLALIVKRHYEIINFTPEKYWELKTVYREVLFTAAEGKFNSEDDAIKVLESIKDCSFTITSFTKKRGTEPPPPLFDLTSLQVECNKRFGFTADNTLKIVQNLYEKKFITYPRVDTRFLPSDLYPKIPGILRGLKTYSKEVGPLLSAPVVKNKKVFDDSKVTDHHAIIPTGISPQNLSLQDEKVYDAVARRFISVFYPDCIVSNTTALGESENIKFKATGRQIIEDGWRVLYPKQEKKDEDEESQIFPEFVKGESGPHTPKILEKETKPPRYYTEATLLRAMETAGKWSDDDEIRDAMKENGIGRPSTRAGIIETLFKRTYIIREKKNIIPTSTGVQLIDTIENDLLKSVELTGIWENKLRLIERGEYRSHMFIEEMKSMISSLVSDVKNESGKMIQLAEKKKKGQKHSGDSKKGKTGTEKNSGKTGPSQPKKRTAIAENTYSAETYVEKKSTDGLDIICPACRIGKIIKGKAAYGCSSFREGCAFRISFEIEGKKLSEKQIFSLIEKGKTSSISGFIVNNERVAGHLTLNEKYIPVLTVKKNDDKPQPVNKGIKTAHGDKPLLRCRKCGLGYMIRGNNAYGCSRYREGCRFLIPFDSLMKDYNSEELTEEILLRIVDDH